MLDVNLFIPLLPQSGKRRWSRRAPLSISELTQEFDALLIVSPRDVMDFMVRDSTNSSSTAAPARRARNARPWRLVDQRGPGNA